MMGKAFTEQEKETVRATIVEVAYGLFASRPFRSVKIEDIAKAAGIGKGTLYLFFSSKEQIFIQVMMRFELTIQSNIYNALKSEDSPKEKLFKAITIGLDLTKENEIYHTLMDSELMARIMGALSPNEIEQLAGVDLDFMDLLIGKLPIKVTRELAVDLLRGVFFLRLFEAQLLSPAEVFYEAYLRGIINQIL